MCEHLETNIRTEMCCCGSFRWVLTQRQERRRWATVLEKQSLLHIDQETLKEHLRFYVAFLKKCCFFFTRINNNNNNMERRSVPSILQDRSTLRSHDDTLLRSDMDTSPHTAVHVYLEDTGLHSCRETATSQWRPTSAIRVFLWTRIQNLR